MQIKGWLRVVFVIVVYLMIGNMFKLVGFFVSGIDVNKPTRYASISELLTISLFDFLGVLLIIWAFLKLLDKQSLANFGLSLKNRINDLFIGLSVGFVIMGFGTIILMKLETIFYQGLNLNTHQLVNLFFLFIIVAFKEEILYRGYILRNLMNSFNHFVALLISALIFALFHGVNSQTNFLTFINIFLGGIMFGLCYMQNKNLWLPISLHFSWNYFQCLFGLNAGDDLYSLFTFKKSDVGMINIRGYLFEQPLLYTMVSLLLVAIMFLRYYCVKKNQGKDLTG
ncbi:MAG: CPBP family intramembrane metalloprotease [Flavobacteriaceae bacterium]|nr:CPBP family intramembrane metalloprotease [Flavobacteriaceae bacterium]